MTRVAEGPARDEDDPPRSVVVDELSFTVRASKFRFAATMMKRTAIPLATEFAVRLIHLVPGSTAEDLAAFFGFGEAEVAVLVQDILETSLVVEREGKFQLSTKGLEAVSPLGEVELFSIEEVTAHLAFDLIAFAPIDDNELDKALARCVPELPLPDRQRAANALAEAHKAFELHFQEWLQRLRRRTDDMRFRSIEDVQQIKAIAVPISVPITYNLAEPSQTEADFSALRQVGIPNSRNPLIESLSGAIQRIAAPREPDWAMSTLSSIDGGVLQRAGLTDVAGVPEWIRQVIAQGVLPKSAPNISLFGSAVGDRCRTALLERSAESGNVVGVPRLFWLPPQVDHWGRSVAFASLLRELLRSTPDGMTLLPRTDFSGPDLKRISRFFRPIAEEPGFDPCIALPDKSPGALEILVRPGSFALALIHTKDPRSGYPLPVGYLTSEPTVIKELAYYVGGILKSVGPESVMWHRAAEDAEFTLERAIDCLWQSATHE